MPIVDVIEDTEALRGLEASWKALFDSSAAASPPLRWEWQYEWWRIFGPVYDPGGRGLRVLVVRRGSQLIGILPLYLGRTPGGPLAARRLCFVSGGEAEREEVMPEYLDILYAPQEEQTSLEALEPFVFPRHNPGWDMLELQHVPSNSPLLPWVEANGRFLRARMRRSDSVSPLADLSGGMEGYLMRKSSRQRNALRRLLRAVDARGIAFEVASTVTDARRYFEQLLELHLVRWRRRGRVTSLASPRVVEFHLSLLERLVPHGHAVIGRLVLDSRPLAVIHGFVVGGKFDFYQSGVRYEVDVPVPSPGIAAHLLMMRHLAERGIVAYDYLAGAAEYKLRLATGERRLVTLDMALPTARWVAHTAYTLGARALRKLNTLARREAAQGDGPLPGDVRPDVPCCERGKDEPRRGFPILRG